MLGEEGTSNREGTTGLRWVVDPLDGTVNYLSGIPMWCVSIACEDAATGAATRTKTSSGGRIQRDATGLPRLDGDRFYQAWLRNAAGALVPVGTFNEGVDVTLWSGVSPKTFTTLSVTRERNDGDQSSSGQKVLVGTVDVGG